MAWQEVTPIVGAAAGKGSVSYSCNPKRGGSRLTILASVVTALKWKKGLALKLFVGGGDHEGMLRLVPDAKGVLVTREMAGKATGGLMVRLGKVPSLPDREVSRVKVEHEVDGEALVVTLPKHAQLVAPTPIAPRPVPAAAAAPAPAPAPAKVDVTARFFNDPKKPPVMAAGTRGARQ